MSSTGYTSVTVFLCGNSIGYLSKADQNMRNETLLDILQQNLKKKS